MKKSLKYVKTRGQKMALEQVNPEPYFELTSNNPQKNLSSTLTSNKNQA